MTQNGQTSTDYDIIIVGAGTAGCVLANRLSEDLNISILLLEAGEERNDDERVYTPGLQAELIDNPEFDWQYTSEPQPGINGRQMKHPRGKVVGGSSAINSFALIYPSSTEIDFWEELGNEGWGWEGMKEYFRKFQTICPPAEEVKGQLSVIDDAGRTTGPIQASYPMMADPLQKAWVETFRTLGLENEKDPTDGQALGGYISTCHVTNDRRNRSHAGVAYYGPARDRPNLTLITGVTVKRVLLKQATDGKHVATGIAYVKDGERIRVQAKKEVILAAGAFATPQLLELSGIGDTALLKRHGIEPLVHNANVGENLQDHIRAGISLEAAEGAVPPRVLPADEARTLYKEKGAGPWAERTCFTFAYMPLTQFLAPSERQALVDVFQEEQNNHWKSGFEEARADFIKKMTLSPSGATATAFLSRKPAAQDTRDRNWITLFAMLSHSFSRGSVHIASPDSKKKPRIDFGYYNHPLDLEVHARHILSLAKLASTKPLSKYINQDGGQLLEYRGLTLDGIKEMIRKWSFTNYHPCGSCSMLPQDSGGVVDKDLRVHGTTNLRIVDASIIPFIPRGNILTTVYACAEKAADIVSQYLGLKRTT